VTGKGQFAETVKFFRLMGKQSFVLADLDALVDDNQLVNVFRDAAEPAANASGMGSLSEIDRGIRDKLGGGGSAHMAPPHWMPGTSPGMTNRERRRERKGTNETERRNGKPLAVGARLALRRGPDLPVASLRRMRPAAALRPAAATCAPAPGAWSPGSPRSRTSGARGRTSPGSKARSRRRRSCGPIALGGGRFAARRGDEHARRA
jgi:hypothetical protein